MVPYHYLVRVYVILRLFLPQLPDLVTSFVEGLSESSRLLVFALEVCQGRFYPGFEHVESCLGSCAADFTLPDCFLHVHDFIVKILAHQIQVCVLVGNDLVFFGNDGDLGFDGFSLLLEFGEEFFHFEDLFESGLEGLFEVEHFLHVLKFLFFHLFDLLECSCALVVQFHLSFHFVGLADGLV